MKLSALLPGFVLFPFSAQANPACVVCTVAVGASLEIARRLGINDNVVGLWAGAMLAVLGYWTIAWFEKKNWRFAGRDFLADRPERRHDRIRLSGYADIFAADFSVSLY